MREANLLCHPFHPRLEQLEFLRIAQPQLIQPLGFSLTHVAGRGLGVRVGILVVATERIPMLIAGALHRLADVVAGERHGQKLSHRELDVQMVAGSHMAQRPETHAPEVQLNQPILHHAATCRAEVGRVRVAVAL